jgi:hypothetical protein
MCISHVDIEAQSTLQLQNTSKKINIPKCLTKILMGKLQQLVINDLTYIILNNRKLNSNQPTFTSSKYATGETVR